MPRFIKTDRVAVTDDEGNTVWIRRRMDLGAVSRIQGALPGEGLVALYTANILGWDGPAFKDERNKTIACTPEAIATLDPDDPFWEQVANRIAELNPRKEDSDPLAATTAGEPPTPASGTAA